MPSPSERARARSQLYQLLALGFSHPESEFLGTRLNGNYQSLIADVTEILFGEAIIISLNTLPFHEFEAQYIDLYQVGNNGRPAVCLHAGDYEQVLDGQSRPEYLLDYTRWYKHFGLKVRQDEQTNELSDHIVCQFEFLSWLANLQSTATEKPELEYGYLRAQRDFIERHTNTFFQYFVPLLSLETKKRNTLPLFYELGALAGTTIERTMHELNSILGPSVQKFNASEHTTVESNSEPVDLWS